MCLAAIAFRATPSHPLVIATNRDEFHARSDVPAAWWPDHPTVLGGRDRATGGTWCAIDRRGRFALLMTPVTPPATGGRGAVASSRGQLVTDWVTGEAHPREFLETLRASAAPWRDFRLVVGDLANGLAGITHRRGVYSDPWQLGAGVHCTDSGPDDHPWPKRRFLAERTRDLLNSAPEDESGWLALLTQREPAPPRFGPADYPSLRTPFTTGHRLGTRACTVIRVLASGECHFVEHRFGPDAVPLGSRTFAFTLSTTLGE